MAFDHRLGDAFVFDEEDLAANRAGELSAEQALLRENTIRARRAHGRRGIGMVVLAVAASVVGVVLTTRSTPGAGAGTLAVGLAIVAGFGALLTILARRNAVSAERMERTRLERVEGEMAIDWEALRETFALLVGGVRFRVDRLQYESVTPGARYAVYYYEGPEGPWLLSLEKLGDA